MSVASRVTGLITIGVATALTALGPFAPSAHAEKAPVYVGSGQEIAIASDNFLTGSTGSQTLKGCTIAYLVVDDNGSDLSALTAGHCGDRGDEVSVGGERIGVIESGHAPATLPGGLIIGNATSPDWAVIDLDDHIKPQLSSDKITPRTVAPAKVGDKVCSTGRTSGWACGTVTAVTGDWITTSIPRDSGDSGGPLYRPADGAALGILGNVTSPLIGPGDTSSQYYSVPAVLENTGTFLAVSTSTDD